MRFLFLLAVVSCGVSFDPIDAQENAALSAMGSACAFSAQCASGACSATGPSCGQCLQVRQLGQTCGGAMQTCNPSARCENGLCRSNKKSLGAKCALQPKGGDAGECDDELYCQIPETFGPEGVCVRPVQLGGACPDWKSKCAWPGVCESGTCTLRRVAVLGESCQARTCAAGLYCDSGHCIEATLPLGARCGIVDGQILRDGCATGTTCGSLEFPNGGGGQSTVSTCLPLPTEGNPCILYACAAGLFCSYAEPPQLPTCKQPSKLGQPCAEGACVDGLECRGGVCAAACR